MEVNEYLVSVDDGGVITVVPIEDFGILDKTDIFYIDMDGDIEQNIIDYCVNEDKEVILFGQEDNCECDGECETVIVMMKLIYILLKTKMEILTDLLLVSQMATLI